MDKDCIFMPHIMLKLSDVVMQSLGLEKRKPDLTDWEAMVENLRHASEL